MARVDIAYEVETASARHLKELGLRYECSDLGNAERFKDQHGHDLKHLSEEKTWVVWDGTRWSHSGGNSAVYARAEATVLDIYDEAKECKVSQGRQKLSNWAFKSQSKHTIDNMLSLSAKALSASVTNFDVSAEEINCRNGIVNLRSGELISHSPDQMVMKRAEAHYKPQAHCPMWLKFLSEIFLGDDELIAYVKKALGYSITGLTTEHGLFIAYGLGANGKTTLFETIREIIGDYGRTTEFSTFLNTENSDSRNREAVGMLKGIRFAIASETGNTTKWNEALVKKLTGGDTLIGAKLYGSSFEFQPTHKLWFQANHLPGVKDASAGFWRRPTVIPFRAKFEGSKIDPQLRERLLEEREGIFAWLVEGAKSYLRHGLGDKPKVCDEATKEYRADNDVLGRFISERMIEKQEAEVGVQSVYDAYSEWCRMERIDATPLKFFSQAMEERGLNRKRTNKGAFFTGYHLGENDIPEPWKHEPEPEWEKPKVKADMRDTLDSLKVGEKSNYKGWFNPNENDDEDEQIRWAEKRLV